MRRALVVLIAALPLFVLPCGGDDGGTPTASSTIASTSTVAAIVAATPVAPVASLRDVAFDDLGLAGPLIDAAGGGEVPLERVEFHDLLGGDGIEEAVVVVESGGSLGDLGVGVFVLIEDAPELVQFIGTAGRIEVRLGLVVTIEGVWGADDPQCCPSQLRETSYQWDGARFVAITEQVVANPDP